jgi:thioredoxin
MSFIQSIHDETWGEFKNRLASLNPDQLVLLDFTAGWCGPCQRIAPFLKTLSSKFPELIIYKIDVDECPEISVNFGVSAMPTFIFLRNGQICDQFSGANPQKLEESTYQLLKK